MTGSAILSASGIRVRYNGHFALDDVRFAAEPGSVIGLIGPNGAGKTTLLKVLAGLLEPESGRVVFDGQDLSYWDKAALARRLGYLSQDRTVHWPVTVGRLVSLGRLPHLGPWQKPGGDDWAAVERALAEADITGLRARTVTTLSGGERARALLARVLAGEPDILLADEPVSGLDPGHRLQLLERLRRVAGEGRTVVIVLHDLTLAARFCDHLVLLHDGRVLADGAPATVLTPDTLQQSYGVDAVTVERDGETTILPWALKPGV